MSLSQRAGSFGSREHQPLLPRKTSQGRKSSVNPVGEWVPQAAQQHPVGAFMVSKSKRLAQVGVAILYCFLAAGIVFGYAALKPVLIQEGVYRDQCTEKELEKGVEVCYGQEIRLNLMFNIAAIATNIFALPVGTVLDRFGPRVSGLVGCFFVAAGCLFMAFAADMAPADGYIPGYLFLALGGPFIFISSFQLSNAFPRNSGLVLAFLTGAFDASSAIFLFYRLTYDALNGSFQPKKFFSTYLIVPIFILIVEIFLMPNTSYKTVSELVKRAEDPAHDTHDSDNELDSPTEVEQIRDQRRIHRESVVSEVTSLLGGQSTDEQAKAEEAKKARSSGVWGALHGRSAWQQMKTPWFILIVLFTMVQMLRINYFVATIRSQYNFLLRDASKAKAINEFFDVALPLGGLVASPFIGLVLDNLSTPFVLGSLVTSATVIGILGVLPYTWAAYANVVLFVLYRPFYYTAVSDYAAKVFGFSTFGKVYGTNICIAGLFNFVQTPLDAATHKNFKSNPIPVNVILLVLAAVVGIALVAYVTIRSYSISREMLETEAESARAISVPYADQRVNEDHHPVDVHTSRSHGTAE